MIAAVAAVAIGATTAYFSDTETSTGNTFTAGAIDLKVDSTQHYNGMVCTIQGTGGSTWQPESGTQPPFYPAQGSPCDGTWTLTDLQNGVQKFFNFTDIKPGDNGENTISLHIVSNPAWACVDVNLTKNDDVSSTEPELATGDPANGDSIFDGELAQNIKFAAWGETDGDNIWEVGEPLLFSNKSGPASDVLGGRTYTLADSATGTPLPGGSTSYIGLAWCAGTQAIVGNTITCDGAGMGNNTQTDSMVASVAFRVEQSRNNGQFVCGGSNQESQSPEPVNLSSVSGFAILSKTGITTTGTTAITGDIGVSPIGYAAITGFALIPTVPDGFNTFSTSALVTGKVYASDYTAPTPANLIAAVSAMQAAYTDANSRAINVTNAGTGSGTWDIAGLSLAPGVYAFNGPGNVIISNDVTLTGSASDVWIFQIPGTLNISAAKKVLLGGGAQASNIIWAVAGTTTLQAGSTFEGTILGGPGASTIAGQSGAILHGRALGQTNVTLIANTVTLP